MKKVWYVLGGVVLVGALGFAYYAISPLFINIKVDEALPESVVGIDDIPSGASVTGTTGHPASGTARVVEADGKTYIRYENFKTINGPDLYVYLAKDLDATEFVDLGRLRATEGNVNYEVPVGVDVSQYRYVLVWCKAFSVLFNSADLAAAR
jgi:hypothetical protein